jgi:hypothetical protein
MIADGAARDELAGPVRVIDRSGLRITIERGRVRIGRAAERPSGELKGGAGRVEDRAATIQRGHV